jgi:DNA-binding CsgD family transcriptional regulator
MSTSTSKKHEDACSASVEIGTSLQQMLCALLTKSEATLQVYEDAEQILFDIDFNGARYLLVKMPLTDRRCAALSPRELEIVRMVAQGHQNKVIAVVLNISSWTVCTHLRRIFAKLGVTSRAAMVARLADFRGLADQNFTSEQLHGRPGETSMTPSLIRRDPPSRGQQARGQSIRDGRRRPGTSRPALSNTAVPIMRSPIGCELRNPLERGVKTRIPRGN